MGSFLLNFSLRGFGVLWLLVILLIWGLHRQWWGIRGVRRALWITPLCAYGVMGIWALAASRGWSGVEVAARVMTSCMVVMVIALVVSLPFSGITLSMERLVRWLQRRRSASHVHPAATSDRLNMNETEKNRVAFSHDRFSGARRSFITNTAAIIPGGMMGAGAWGLIDSFSAVRMPEIPLYFPDLHPDLHGLRVLHLSDIHLGYYLNLKGLEQIMIDAEKKHADLVMVTGDIADDLTMLPGALEMMAGLQPRHGIYASLGNHEYHRGLDVVLRSFERSTVPLLRDSGASVKIGTATLHVAGADDPVRSGRGSVDGPAFLRSTVEAAYRDAPSDAFHLLMSHRPKGFDAAAEKGIELTIAGHTHGGIQLGIGGRSVMEPWMGEHYLWGHYQKGRSQLYTSGGVGHWFPFRLGCPPEAPVYILQRG